MPNQLRTAAIVFSVLCWAIPSAAGDWPQWRYDAARSAASPDELPDKLNLQWTRQLPAPRPAWPASQPSLRFDVSYSPVAAGKTLFVPSMVTDTVTAYDTESGAEKWRFYAEGPVRLAPAFNGGKLYFGSDDGYLYCLEAESGKLLWRFGGAPYERKILGNERLISTWPIRGGPVLSGGVVYFTAGVWPFMGVFVRAVDAETGKPVWTNSGESSRYQIHPHKAPSFSSLAPRGYPAVVKDLLAVPGGRTPPGYFDPQTGKLVSFSWSKRDGRAWNVSGDGRSIKAGSRTFTAKGREVSSGDWKADLGGDAWNLLAADGKLFATTTDGKILCFGAKADNRLIEPAAVETDRHKTWTELAKTFLRSGKIRAGYCVVLGLGSGGLAEALLRNSELYVITVDPDARKIDAFRRRMQDAGLYGTRVSAHVGNPVDYPLPPYLADLIVSEDLKVVPSKQFESFVKSVFAALRPYGGTACFRIETSLLGRLAKPLEAANAKVTAAGKGWSLLVRDGALPGSADWTHNYADAGNSVVSNDELVKAPLGLLWFGNGPSNDEVLPRHGHGPAPQVAGGRLVIEGGNMLRCLDIYTGRLLWQKDMPGLGAFYDRTGHQPGAGEIGGNYVTLEDAVYVVYEDSILDLDPDSGETRREYELKPGGDGAQPFWGAIAAWDKYLVATSTPAVVEGGSAPKARPKQPPESLAGLFRTVRYSSASRRLVVFDRRSGKQVWTRDAVYGFRHNNIAVAAGKLFCIDGLSPAKLDALKRRGAEGQYRPRLWALDLSNGRELWSTGEDVFGTFLGYSTEHDVLLQAGSRYRDRARDEVGTGMVAYRGDDGRVLWKNLKIGYAGPCMLHGDKIIAQGPAYSLLNGKPIARKHALTGTPMPWWFTRNYGCNTAIASRHLITFRSGAAGYYDLANDGGTGNFGGFKSSCTSNLIAAGGLLNAPEYTRTCTCNYQNQTSLALVHDPSVETWTFNSYDWDGRPVRQAGINLAAPGDRRSEGGTLWLDFPSQGGHSPNIPVTLEIDPAAYFRFHNSRVQAESGELDWVAASGIEGAGSITLTLAKEATAARKYTVRLHFAEVNGAEAGRRVFDVSLQGKKVLPDFDVAAAAGGANRAIVKEFKGVKIADKLKISLAPAKASSLPPVLCGVEVVAQGW